MLDHVGVLWDEYGDPVSLQLAATSADAKKVLAAFDGKKAYLSKTTTGKYKGTWVLMIPPPTCLRKKITKKK